jgi:hypothetical protein
LLAFTEQFDNASWSKQQSTVSANAGAAPDGTTTADKLIPSVVNDSHWVGQNVTVSSVAYTFSFYAKADGYSIVQILNSNSANDRINFDLSNGTVGSALNYTGTITDVGSGRYRCTATFTASAGTAAWARIGIVPDSTSLRGAAFAGDGTSGVLIWGAQLELGSTATGYQRVGASSRSDVSEAGQPQVYFVSPDGTDDFMVSAANVNFSATDRMFVCAGVTKKSDAARNTVVELTASAAANNGAFQLTSPNAASATYGFESKGTTLTDAVATPFAAPITNIVSGLGNIAGDSTIIRVNGVQADADTGDQGAGNYSNALTYVGARAGTSQFTSANIYQLIAVGKTPTTPELSATENFVAQKTKGTLA